MTKKNLFNIIFLSLAIFGVFLLIYQLGIINHHFSNNSNSTINSMTSTDPLNPNYLGEPSEYENYASQFTNYYYQCYAVSNAYYLLWLCSDSSSDDSNLYLYSNSGYSTLLVMGSENTKYDWVLNRPSSNGYLYPKVHTYTDTGWGYIQFEAHVVIVTGQSQSVTLSSSNFADIFAINLVSGKQYTINLDVPSGVDFDVYLYHLYADEAITSGDYEDAGVYGIGVDESVTFYPTISDTFGIVVIRVSGTGTATLTVSTPSGVPGFELLPILISFLFFILISVIWLKRGNRFLWK